MSLKRRDAIVALTVVFGLSTSAEEFFYVVKKGETVSSILSDHGLRIYGKRGALAETLKLNPEIKATMGNKIFPDMKIRIASSKVYYLSDSIQKIKEETPVVVEAPVALTPEVIIPLKAVSDRSPSDDFKQSFFWEVSPTLSWKSLSSTDENVYRKSKVNALSNTNYGASVTYGMHFAEGLDLYSNIFLESVGFVQDSAINLVKKDFISSRFVMGLRYERSWQLEAGMSDEIFLTSPSAKVVEIKKITLPEIKATYLKDFYQYKSATLSVSLSANAFLPRTSPDVTSKLSYGGGGAIEAKLQNQSFKIGFDTHQLNAVGNSTNSQNIYWKYTWETL